MNLVGVEPTTIHWDEYRLPPPRLTVRFLTIFFASVVILLPFDGRTAFLFVAGLLQSALWILYSERHPRRREMRADVDGITVDHNKIAWKEIDDITLSTDWMEVRWMSRNHGAGLILIRRPRLRGSQWETLQAELSPLKEWHEVHGR